MKRKKVVRRAVRKSSHAILKEDSIEKENEERLNNESERENLPEEKEIDNLDLGDDNSHLEDEEQGEEEEY